MVPRVTTSATERDDGALVRSLCGAILKNRRPGGQVAFHAEMMASGAALKVHAGLRG